MTGEGFCFKLLNTDHIEVGGGRSARSRRRIIVLQKALIFEGRSSEVVYGGGERICVAGLVRGATGPTFIGDDITLAGGTRGSLLPGGTGDGVVGGEHRSHPRLVC